MHDQHAHWSWFNTTITSFFNKTTKHLLLNQQNQRILSCVSISNQTDYNIDLIQLINVVITQYCYHVGIFVVLIWFVYNIHVVYFNIGHGM